MFTPKTVTIGDKTRLYREIHSDMIALMDRAWFTNLANASALLMHYLGDVNWAGFYLLQGDELLLGPFQGKPACLRIAVGKGVCGTAAKSRQTLIVPDVHQFPGHIACDSESRSEIVVPLLFNERSLGVLDLDAPVLNRFDHADRAGLEEMTQILIGRTQWPETFF